MEGIVIQACGLMVAFEPTFYDIAIAFVKLAAGSMSAEEFLALAKAVGGAPIEAAQALVKACKGEIS